MKAQKLYPFVPSGDDYELAISFFESLGFTKTWGDDQLCGLSMAGAYFLLQNHENIEWQQNQMIVIEVDDLDAYWDMISEKDLEKTFKGVKIKKPTDYPWGREVHIIDPAGVCWHLRAGEG
ncbi:bleomycin resistance protein [Balneolaceae bacterium YR4-1]|uniref:Bleomycin resistance protein n=1 Tax=Halalkalibaculum roseum TaxID=2709311 RepID=A0A6M1SSB9_9BACT|nr:bleomycin resistance protein [Halalkalibaculum roseum]NGP77969.1 bleomycin resistance protein [Halalkalibaculum roseum]